MSGRGRTCPARLWMVYGWLWEGRGPGMPGPYRAAIFAAGGALNARRRGQDPSLQYLWKSRCLLGYWAVGAGHVRPGYGWCTGGYGKAAGRACPAPTGRQFLQRGGALNARRRGQDPSLQYLWKSRCLLVYWAVGAGHARPGCGWCMGGYGKAAGRACPAPTGRQFLQRAAVGDTDGHGKARQSPSGLAARGQLPWKGRLFARALPAGKPPLSGEVAKR